MTRSPVILFDVGNVLFCDPWETLLLTPGSGLADRRGIDRHIVAKAGRRLWSEFSTAESSEDQYWRDLERELGIRISAEEVRELEKDLLFANPDAALMLGMAKDSGLPLGIASNNTSFWFAKQWKALELERYIEAGLVFVSHRLGVEKNSPGKGLFEIAAEAVPAGESLVIDDQRGNLHRAEQAGFRVEQYSLEGAGRVPSFASVEWRMR